jgi:hypothetical protein
LKEENLSSGAIKIGTHLIISNRFKDRSEENGGKG